MRVCLLLMRKQKNKGKKAPIDSLLSERRVSSSDLAEDRSYTFVRGV